MQVTPATGARFGITLSGPGQNIRRALDLRWLFTLQGRHQSLVLARLQRR